MWITQYIHFSLEIVLNNLEIYFNLAAQNGKTKYISIFELRLRCLLNNRTMELLYFKRSSLQLIMV